MFDRMVRGEEIQITGNGWPVTRLAPEPGWADIQALIAEMRAFRKGRRLGNDLTVKDLIEDGRRT